MNDTNLAFSEIFDSNGDCKFNDEDICLVDIKRTESKIGGLYIGKCDIKEGQWNGIVYNSCLPFDESQTAIRINDISGFTKLSNCKTMPLYNKIYLVKRYIENKQFRIHGLQHAYFIASRLEDFYPSFWYVSTWGIPCELYLAGWVECFDGCSVVMINKDDEFIRLN